MEEARSKRQEAEGLRVLVALPRPIVTLLTEENGEIVPVARWDRARGVNAVPPLRETPKLDAIIGALQDRPVHLTLLRQATVEALQDALRDQPHVFVLDTHGDENGLLLFEGPCGETNPLLAIELGTMLARRGVRLAVLSACYSKVAAQAVRQAGVPLAVGMTESIYEDAAAAYLAALLGALACGDSPHDAHQDGLTRLRTRFDRRPYEIVLPCLLATNANQPLLPRRTSLSLSCFADNTPPLPQPEPELPVAHLFGRELDQVWIQRLLLEGDGRLVTLTGTGGIGKTALARTRAPHCRSHLPETGPRTAAHRAGRLPSDSTGRDPGGIGRHRPRPPPDRRRPSRFARTPAQHVAELLLHLGAAERGRPKDLGRFRCRFRPRCRCCCPARRGRWRMGYRRWVGGSHCLARAAAGGGGRAQPLLHGGHHRRVWP
ncbi:MAG: CHAT domain-containing protein [Anaerolineae bacterium]|nr:CHAT domain-containing protein [Anaerolineae bacterium]